MAQKFHVLYYMWQMAKLARDSTNSQNAEHQKCHKTSVLLDHWINKVTANVGKNEIGFSLAASQLPNRCNS